MAASPLYIFRQFVEEKEAIGLNAGTSKYFDKYSRVATGGGVVAETDTVPNDSWSVVQASVTVSDYANKIPYTEDLVKSSEFDITNIQHVMLRDDMVNTYDKVVGAIAKTAKFKAVCVSTASTAFTTNGTATVTAGVNMDYKNVKDVVDYAKKAKIPRYQFGKDYILIVPIDNERSLHDSLTPYMQYTDPSMILNGEIGRIYGCRIVEENNVLSNSVGTGAKAEAILLGGDAMWEAVVFPEEIRMDIPYDLGRKQYVGWVGRQGFKKVWDYATDSEEHIIHITSA